MIPPFDQQGYLPPGVHGATMEEVAALFGQGTEVRQAQVESLYWLLDVARKAGVRRIIIDGSFTTRAREPNDVDCVLLIDSSFPLDPGACEELLEGFPYLQLMLEETPIFDYLVTVTFATDRRGIPKGMIEVLSWN
jgi:hypothetical protein